MYTLHRCKRHNYIVNARRLRLADFPSISWCAKKGKTRQQQQQKSKMRRQKEGSPSGARIHGKRAFREALISCHVAIFECGYFSWLVHVFFFSFSGEKEGGYLSAVLSGRVSDRCNILVRRNCVLFVVHATTLFIDREIVGFIRCHYPLCLVFLTLTFDPFRSPVICRVHIIKFLSVNVWEHTYVCGYTYTCIRTREKSFSIKIEKNNLCDIKIYFIFNNNDRCDL